MNNPPTECSSVWEAQLQLYYCGFWVSHVLWPAVVCLQSWLPGASAVVGPAVQCMAGKGCQLPLHPRVLALLLHSAPCHEHVNCAEDTHGGWSVAPLLYIETVIANSDNVHIICVQKWHSPYWKGQEEARRGHVLFLNHGCVSSRLYKHSEEISSRSRLLLSYKPSNFQNCVCVSVCKSSKSQWNCRIWLLKSHFQLFPGTV